MNFTDFFKTKTELFPFEVEQPINVSYSYNEGASLNLALFPEHNNRLAKLVSKLVATARELAPKKGNRNGVCGLEEAGAILLYNLVSVARSDWTRKWVSVSLNKRDSGFPRVSDKTNNPHGVSLESINLLREAAIKLNWIEVKRGFCFAKDGKSAPSRIRLRPNAYERKFMGIKVRPALDKMAAVRIRDDRKILVKGNREGTVTTKRIKFDVALPTADERIPTLTKFMNEYNAFRRTYAFEADFIEDGIAEYTTYKNGKAVHHSKDLENAPCTMIYSRGSLDKNGRIYNNGFQSLPGELRSKVYVKYIDSEGNAQRRLMKGKDFGACAFTFLALLNGYQPTKKFYHYVTVAGVDAKTSETIVKYVLSSAINCDKDADYCKAARSRINGKVRKLPIKLTDEVINGIIAEYSKKFKWFKDAIANDRGVELMNIEAKVARKVIAHFMNEGVPVEGVHDGFYVPEGHEGPLEVIMRMYAAIELGVKDPDVAYHCIKIEDA